jgi:hypothetical protein
LGKNGLHWYEELEGKDGEEIGKGMLLAEGGCCDLAWGLRMGRQNP